MDFVTNLETDMSLAILSCLDDPSDLVRASAVSRSWREFVIKNNLSKNLCVNLFNQLSSIDRITETSNDNEESSETASSSSLMEMKLLEREHRAYALLARGCALSPIESIIAEAIVASSTDNDPDENIANTLEERDRIGPQPSYWSSKGQHKASVPETLLYKLEGDLCVITEINVQPFQAYFQPGGPIYSSHYIRFHLGHCNNNSENESDDSVESNYVWTYTSQEFPMAQENRLQSFKLPEPVICIGGYILIEFLGRVQTQEMDGLYYICVAHVKVMGRSLAKSFRVMNPKNSGKFDLKVMSYDDPKEMDNKMEAEAPEAAEASRQSRFRAFRPMENLEQLLNFLHRNPLEVEYVWPDSDNEDEEDAESDDDEVEV